MTMELFAIAALGIISAYLGCQLYSADRYIEELEDEVEVLRLQKKHWRWQLTNRRQYERE